MQQQTGQAREYGELKETGLAAAILAEAGAAVAGLTGAGLAGTGLDATSASESERKRVEAVVETLANLRGGGESLAEVAHDARNMVTALGLYCDLLEEPGVLTAPFLHYASELRLVATASRRLVEKLLALDLRLGPLEGSSRSDGLSWPAGANLGRTQTEPAGAGPFRGERPEYGRHWDLMPPVPIANLAAELKANRNLLSALAGPSITVTMEAEEGAQPVRMNGEDLTRILVNLVKNAAEAMPEGGRIAIGLHEFHAGAQTPPWLMLTIEDTGPGIPKRALEKIFDSGYTTRSHGASGHNGWPASHRGLGLSITRSIVEAAGGHIHAASRAAPGARFEIDLPSGSR
ncbi:MAG: sensor histidine kinase [Terracidiphilus sp.]|jgi:signal transduction histidine kinase